MTTLIRNSLSTASRISSKALLQSKLALQTSQDFSSSLIFRSQLAVRRSLASSHLPRTARTLSYRENYYYPPGPQGRDNVPARYFDTNLAFQPTLIARHFSSSRSLTMSDEDYAAFLNKANKDYSGTAGKASQKKEGISARAHPAIKALGDCFYASESDEPFRDVTFEYGGSALPSEAEFGALIDAEEGDIKKLTPSSWDPNRTYEGVTSAVQKAAGGADIAVFRYTVDSTRIWYYVLGLDESLKSLVGVKVLAIES
ncbi:hypothetical protein TWF694_001782 [Orbilia ellipsospora]|uniref:Uncharacterized protein n=1 Tax=Orbilia ellipsospora TaxID=2528407 RepID=A0AAV9X514_9PEZI